MNTARHIEQLLYRHQCVGIPGFGAFLTETKPARLDEAAHTFFPPAKVLSFNPLLKNNDGLLASHVARAERLSYDDALDRIAQDVAVWRDALIAERRLTLPNIGVLSVNAEGNLVFEEAGQVNYFTGAFGLSSFVSPAIRREVLAVVGEDVAEEEPLVLVPQRTESRQWLKYAAIFAIGLGTSGFFGNRYYQDRIAKETEIVQAEVQKEVGNRIQQATFFLETPLENVVLPVEKTWKPYHIVAGAFREEGNAQRVFEKLTAQGFAAERLEPTRKGLYPVSYGSYATLSEAQAALDTIRKQHGGEAWLLVTKRH
ncbi:MAG TPA: SPOR domain-containing protein [Flavobacterium sp.]|nr:SPOR domain-containing protein [Flavobacterium sp.]